VFSVLAGQEIQPPSSVKDINPIFKRYCNGVKSSFLKRDNGWKILMIGAAAGISSFADNNIESYLKNNRIMPEFLAETGNQFGALGAPALAMGAVMLSGIKKKQSYKEIYPDLEMIFGAYSVNFLTVYSIKLLARRERPDKSNKRSFPSGHSANSFLMASLLTEMYGTELSIPFYGLATLVALSRLQQNRHYLSDVIMGAGIGFVIGRGFVNVYDRKNSYLQINPVIFRGQKKTGVGIQFILDF